MREDLFVCLQDSGLADSPRRLGVWICVVMASMFAKSNLIRTTNIRPAITPLRLATPACCLDTFSVGKLAQD